MGAVMLRILHCRVAGLIAIVITSTYMVLIATLDATYAQTFVANSTELLKAGGNYKNCSDAAGCGPSAGAPEIDPKGFDKFKKHFKPNGKKPKLCDIIAYGPKGEQPSHFVTVVGFTPNGDPLTVGQNGSPPAATAPASKAGNVTLNSADTWQNTGKQDTEWESYTPIDDPNTGQPPPLPKDITDKSAEAEKHQPPTNDAERKAWLAIWLACRERNYALMGADASGIRTSRPITLRSTTPQSADAPQYVALPPTNSSTGFYAGGQIINNWGRVRSTETSATTYAVTNQFSDSGDPIGVGIIAGYNFAPWNNSIVVGPFVSVDWLKQTINHTFPAGTFLGTTTHWIITAGGKGGYVVTPGLYLYGLAGASWLNQDLNVNFATAASRNTTTPGFTLGIGGEYQPNSWRLFGNPVSVFLQYQHTWWGTANFNTPTSSPFFNYAFKRDDDTVRLGVNVHLSH
jgi:hypothetical protein